MRTRLHPYLVLALICFGLIVLTLALASCGTTAPRPTAAKSSAEAPLVVGGMGQVGTDWSAFVNPGSDECGAPSTAAPPTRERVAEVEACAREEFRALIASGAVVPAGGFTWPHEEIERILQAPICVSWFDRPIWFASVAPGLPYALRCNAGISSYPCVWVSIQDPARALPLTLWEKVNRWLGAFGRADLFDGEVIGTVLTACRLRGVV